MSYQHRYFATVPLRLEQLLADELHALGARAIKQTVAGCFFEGDLELGYRVALWSRLANTVLLPIEHFRARDPEELYEGVQSVDWEAHFGSAQTMMVTFNSAASQIRHTRYGAQVVKDAVVDQLRDRGIPRPSVDLRDPDLHLNCHVHRDQATLSLDLSGDSLHRRSYRMQSVVAPLKENVAAAVLQRADLPAMLARAEREGAPISIVDPMCGSGTLLIEAALMAADIAPGLLRHRFGFEHWGYHDDAAWQRLLREAETRRDHGLRHLDKRVRHFVGSDSDPRAVRAAHTNIFGAGLRDLIIVHEADARDVSKPEPATDVGLVVTNAPYGERLEADGRVAALHEEIGDALLRNFEGWRATVLTGSKELGFRLGIRASRTHSLYNGALECSLLHFELAPEQRLRPR